MATITIGLNNTAFAGSAPFAVGVKGTGSITVATDIVTAVNKIASGTNARTTQSSVSTDDVPFNKAYYMMAHNAYEHGSGIKDLLDGGYRALELDVYTGWNTDSIIVSHDGFGSNHCGPTGEALSLEGCAYEIKSWLDSNSINGPLVIFIDLKSIGWTTSELGNVKSSFTNIGFTDNDFITPNEVRDAILAQQVILNSTDSLKKLVEAHGMPNITGTNSMSSKGKILLLVTGTAGKHVKSYINAQDGDSALWGCNNSSPIEVTTETDSHNDTDAERYGVCANISHTDHVQDKLNKSYSLNQLNHFYEAVSYVDDATYSWNYFSVAHGAQFINRNSDDFPDVNTFGNRLPVIGIRRSVPGYFSMQWAFGGRCVDVRGYGQSNGTIIQSYDCGSSKSNQQFAYTAEFQLRPKNATNKCLDVKGAHNGIGNWDEIHLHRCDEGNSEKWYMTKNAEFYNKANNNLCFGTGGGNSGSQGTPFWLRYCSKDWAVSFSHLIAKDDFTANN